MREALVAHCAACVGLCCDFLAFDAGEFFAFDKAAGERCRYLSDDHRCSIHEDLAARGMRGCARFTCGGAGQRTTALLGTARPARAVAEVFFVLRVVNELRLLIDEARRLSLVDDDDGLEGCGAALDAVAAGSFDELAAVDVIPLRRAVEGRLRRLAPRVRPRLRVL